MAEAGHSPQGPRPSPHTWTPCFSMGRALWCEVPLAWLAQGLPLRAEGPVTDIPLVLGLLLAPEGLAHQGDQDRPERKKGIGLSKYPGSLHTPLGFGDKEGGVGGRGGGRERVQGKVRGGKGRGRRGSTHRLALFSFQPRRSFHPKIASASLGHRTHALAPRRGHSGELCLPPPGLLKAPRVGVRDTFVGWPASGCLDGNSSGNSGVQGAGWVRDPHRLGWLAEREEGGGRVFQGGAGPVGQAVRRPHTRTSGPCGPGSPFSPCKANTGSLGTSPEDGGTDLGLVGAWNSLQHPAPPTASVAMVCGPCCLHCIQDS